MDARKLTVYLTDDELKAIGIAAAIDGKSKTVFCKDAALQMAQLVTKTLTQKEGKADAKPR